MHLAFSNLVAAAADLAPGPERTVRLWRLASFKDDFTELSGAVDGWIWGQIVLMTLKCLCLLQYL